jgi:hypothetical protein
MPNHKRCSNASTLSSRVGRDGRQPNHAEVAGTIALADPALLGGTAVLARHERGSRSNNRLIVPDLVQQQAAAIALEGELEGRLVVAGVEFAGLDGRIGRACAAEVACCALDVEAQRADLLAVGLDCYQVVDFPDPVALGCTRARCLLALTGFEGSCGAEAGGGEEGGGEELELHFGGCLLEDRL